MANLVFLRGKSPHTDMLTTQSTMSTLLMKSSALSILYIFTINLTLYVRKLGLRKLAQSCTAIKYLGWDLSQSAQLQPVATLFFYFPQARAQPYPSDLFCLYQKKFH